MSVAIPFARSRLRFTRTSSLAQPLMTVAVAHAAPTAPAPIIPILMICPHLRWEFSVKAVEPNGEQGRRHVLIRKKTNGAQLAEESSCVEPYATSCREHFERSIARHWQ